MLFDLVLSSGPGARRYLRQDLQTLRPLLHLSYEKPAVQPT